MQRLSRWIALLLVSLVLSVGAAAAEDVVTARLQWEPGQLGDVAAQQIPLRDRAAASVTLPEGVAGLRIGTAVLGAGRSLALAVSTEHVYVDTDMDGDLSDERPMPWKRSGEVLSAEPTVNVPEDAEAPPVAVPVAVYGPAASITEQVSFHAKAHRKGSVVLAGRLRQISIGDASGNLRFDDAEDVVYLDVDGDGELEVSVDSHERIPVGSAFRIGDKAWTVQVTGPWGAEIEFMPERSLPAPRPRQWPRVEVPEPGQPVTPPAEGLATLLARFEEERDKPHGARKATVADIGRTGDLEAATFLLEVAKSDRQVTIRVQAVGALGNPAYVDHGEEVAEIALGGDGGLAGAAIPALYKMGYSGRAEVFRELVGSAASAVSSPAIRHVCYEQDPKGVKAVIEIASKANAPITRQVAYNALRSLLDGPPPKAMLAAARDEYPQLRARALDDLAAVGHPDTLELAREAAAVRPVHDLVGRTVVRLLARSGGADAIVPLLELGADSEPMRVNVVKELRPVRGLPAMTALVGALRRKNPVVRSLATQILAGIAAPGVVPALRRRAAKERDETTLAIVLEALGDQRDLDSVQLLIKAATKSRSPLVRDAAIYALARIGFDVPKIRKFFLSLMTSERFEDRIYAIDAAGASGDEALVPKLLPNLAHEKRQVRQATAAALRRLRSAQAVRSLIDRLEVEDVRRIRNAIARALFETTGMGLYDDYGLWDQWWKDTAGEFEVPEEVPVRPTREKGSTGAAFYGIPIDSDRVCFVIDQSGSMGVADATPSRRGRTSAPNTTQTRLEVAVKELLLALEQMPDGVYFNVIRFHTTVFPWQKEVVKLGKKTRKAISRELLGQKPGGNTNLYDGLEMALLDREVDTIILLSDGAPGTGRFVVPDDIVRAVSRLNQTRRTVIHCVSVGRGSDLLRRLAKLTGGTYVRH